MRIIGLQFLSLFQLFSVFLTYLLRIYFRKFKPFVKVKRKEYFFQETEKKEGEIMKM